VSNVGVIIFLFARINKWALAAQHVSL
jgi:hypothetical protein